VLEGRKAIALIVFNLFLCGFMGSVFWFEKYRPRSFDEVVDLEEVKARLMGFVKSGDMPHLLFYGPPGTGKTTMALVLARELYGEYWRENTLELNASDERGINVIRERVKEFARTAPVGKAPFKLVILDEADNMTSDAQQALRRIMENIRPKHKIHTPSKLRKRNHRAYSIPRGHD
jgi:replication factor C small subunit